MKSKVVCFGEVLWDVFPDHKKIGGAPLNVALRLNSFGVNATIISSIGNDHSGKELLNFISENNLDATNIQINNEFQTGCVNVTLDEKGSASYKIAYPVAWDKIELNEKSITLVSASDAFIFGSLACRDSRSKKTLLTLIEHSKFSVFDINLRPPFYSIDLLIELMNLVDFIKLNDEEMNEICIALGCEDINEEKRIEFISNFTKTDQICVTKGKDGAILFYEGKFYKSKGCPVKVIDTVGAGDSFLAALIFKLLENSTIISALNYASAVGALVAGSDGANPKFTEAQILDFLNNPLK